MMTAIGCDHAGFSLKCDIINSCIVNNIKDYGTYSDESCDYPVFAKRVVKSILQDECKFGILICGTGIGMSIAANRFKNIRAAICYDAFTARMAREHNDANILVLGARAMKNKKDLLEIIKIFFSTQFCREEKHLRRINLLNNLDADLFKDKN
jgi:ribose 5-phosphate isomerase B